MPHYFVTAN